MTQKTSGIHALRVVQIDAKILDDEIEKIIQTQLELIVANLPIRWAIIWQKLNEEIKLVLSAVLWSYRFLKGISPGQEMMDVSYVRYTKNRVVSHFLVAVFLPYLLKKLEDSIRNRELKERVRKISAVGKLIGFVHHLYFLNQGGYRSVWERILKLKSEYINSPTIGLLNYTDLNRELLWHSYRDFLILLLPIYQKISIIFRQYQARKFGVRYSDDEEKSMKPFEPLLCSRCKLAATLPVRNEMPENLECGHVFCYYCYDPEVECPECGLELAVDKEMFLRGFKLNVNK